MKKVILLAVFLLFAPVHIISPHGQGVHQHMVRQAYGLLQHLYGDIPEMLAHLGYNEIGNIVFDPGNKLVIGAHREDEEDVVYWHFGQPGVFAVTSTHFYVPDGGENWHFVIGGETYENAYQKALKYICGGYELRVHCNVTHPKLTEVLHKDFYNSVLVFHR